MTEPRETDQDFELKLLLTAVEEKYGYEFGSYARASLMRRVRRHMQMSGVEHISDLIPLFLHDESAFAAFVKDMSVVVTEMFRNPDFFKSLRENIVPILKTYPFIKVWHAGCASGQEAYSMAILLDEEGLLDRCQIYATDFNDQALRHAKTGIYPEEDMALYEENYRQAGGTKELSKYCHRGYDSVKFNGRLAEHITFANHNLVTDGVFGEMNLILCRNVLIYFNQDLQNRVLQLLFDSLCSRGILCIGKRENIQFSSIGDQLEVADRNQKIYRKKI
ncbi:CheR family methyltransferase [Endozoicomonas arenosclerae]|uniref:CheR family methyltransferase n=1 Tax=Endozoicomonas arenosclerae TaxID=1633495 RepID=UPI000782B666|nr:protein-glutamate O-methyltransferase CheR [Endozoicomonas arenosclerae]